MINKMLSVRTALLVTLFVRFVLVYAGETNYTLRNTSGNPTRNIYSKINSIFNSNSDVGGHSSITSNNFNNNNNNWLDINKYFQERSISSGSSFINSAQDINSNFYKTINYNSKKPYIPPERTVLSTVVVDDSSRDSQNFEKSNPLIFNSKNQNYTNNFSPQNITVSLIRKNTRKPFATFNKPDYSSKNRSNHLRTAITAKPSILHLKSKPGKLKPSVRLDEDEDDEDEEEDEDDDEEEEDYGEDTGFDSGLEDSDEEEDEEEEVDSSQSTDVDGKDEEKEEEDNYEESDGSALKKKKHLGKKKKKKKHKKKKDKGHFKIKHLKKLKKYMFPLLLAYKLKFFTLIPLLLGGLVLIVGTTGFAGFFFALFAIGLSLQKH